MGRLTLSPHVCRLMLLIGHEKQRAWFRHAIRSGRLASTFLFVGPEGIGKRTFARSLAQSLMCARMPAASLQPCGECESCVQIEAATHPDLLEVGKAEDRAVILMEDLVGSKELRMREGLCRDLHLSPMSGTRRIAIIDDADYLSDAGANALLKTLEEPPPAALIFLIGTSAQRQLPTIRSRCQIVRFAAPSFEEALLILQHSSCEQDASVDDLRAALEQAEGDPARARLWLDEDFRALRKFLDESLSQAMPSAILLAKQVSLYVEAGGSEARDRRERLRVVSDLAAEFYHRRLRDTLLETSGDLDSLRLLGTLLQRSLDVRSEVDRNANQATLIEAWASQLQQAHAAAR